MVSALIRLWSSSEWDIIVGGYRGVRVEDGIIKVVGEGDGSKDNKMGQTGWHKLGMSRR